MLYLRRIFMVSAALVAVHMQGCGCNDDKKYYPPPQDESFTVNGAASKGILRGFQVSAHMFDNGVLDPTPIVITTTNDLGAYSFRLPKEAKDQPILYRVTPSASGSTMVCDLAAGCGGDVDFGESLTITDPTFKLDAVVGDADDNPVTNITMFTDLATSLALEGNESSNEDIASLIEESNSRVANRFGIIGSLTTLPVIDLTNRTAVEAALNAGNGRYIQYAAMNAAIAQAVVANSANGTAFASALNTFRNYYAGGGIAGNSNMPGITSYADILGAARNILNRVSIINPQAPLNFSALQQYLTAEEELANNEEPDSRSTGTPSQTAGATPLAKAKAMVEDLRNLAVSIGESPLQGGGMIGPISEEFAVQLEAAEMVSSEAAGHLIEAMAVAAAAIDDANRAHSDNLQLTSYTSDTGVLVSIDVVDDVTMFGVDQNIAIETDSGSVSIAVVLDAHDSVVFAETDTTNSVEMTVDGGYEVMGSATSAILTMKVKDGSSVEVSDMAVVESVDTETSQASETQSLEMLDLNLMVELAQRMQGQVTDPITFNGTLMASVADAMVMDTENASSGNSTITVGQVSLKLSGIVSNTTGESANFAVSVSGDGTGVSFVESWTAQSDTYSGETTTNYGDLYGSLSFTAKLSGIPSVVAINYSIARTGLEDADNTLTIKYPGKLFRFNMLIADGAPEGNLTITNHDGVVMRLMETTVQGESRLQGTISLDGTQYGTIEEDDSVTIEFIDGAFAYP